MEKPEVLIITLTEDLSDIIKMKKHLENNGYNISFINETKGPFSLNENIFATIIHESSLSQWDFLNALLKIRNGYPEHPILIHSSEDILEEGFSSALGDTNTFLFNDLDLLENGLQTFILKKEDQHKIIKRILFVDDDENILNSYTRMFRDSPWKIITASSGEEALELLKQNQINLIVTDIKMPKMHGIELITKIREHDKKLPIIVCSGYQALQEDHNLRLHGVIDFVEKPIDKDALISKLEKMLDE